VCRRSKEGNVEKLTTKYAQETLQRRKKIVSNYLGQFKRSPYLRASSLSNDLAQVMSERSLKRAEILAMKRATSPVFNKGFNDCESMILHGCHVGAWTSADVKLLFSKSLTHSQASLNT
jgi:hypothetical protein